MPDDRWRPLQVRGSEEMAQAYDILTDGVPLWLEASLIDWLDKMFLMTAQGVFNQDNLHLVEVEIRVKLDWRFGVVTAHQSLIETCKQSARLFLSVLDLALRELAPNAANSLAIDGLEQKLRAGGSAWMVAPDRQSLVRRVRPEAIQAARAIIESGSRAGHHLAEAWRRTYGRNPDASGGYNEACKAVEACVCPVIIPGDPVPTLGKAITALRDAPNGKFQTILGSGKSGFAPLDAVRGLMDLVWSCQRDRHGTANEGAPLQASLQEAEAVLYAALTLVQWFSSGAVHRAGP